MVVTIEWLSIYKNKSINNLLLIPFSIGFFYIQTDIENVINNSYEKSIKFSL